MRLNKKVIGILDGKVPTCWLAKIMGSIGMILFIALVDVNKHMEGQGGHFGWNIDFSLLLSTTFVIHNRESRFCTPSFNDSWNKIASKSSSSNFIIFKIVIPISQKMPFFTIKHWIISLYCLDTSFQIVWKHYDDAILHSKVMWYCHYWTKRYLYCELQCDHIVWRIGLTYKINKGWLGCSTLCAIMVQKF